MASATPALIALPSSAPPRAVAKSAIISSPEANSAFRSGAPASTAQSAAISVTAMAARAQITAWTRRRRTSTTSSDR